jgi:hypothetical protein
MVEIKDNQAWHLVQNAIDQIHERIRNED